MRTWWWRVRDVMRLVTLRSHDQYNTTISRDG